MCKIFKNCEYRSSFGKVITDYLMSFLWTTAQCVDNRRPYSIYKTIAHLGYWALLKQWRFI